MARISVLGYPFTNLHLYDLERVQSLREHTVYPKGQERYIKPIEKNLLNKFLLAGDVVEEPFTPDWVVGVEGEFATIGEALISDDVLDGHKILILSGTYEIDTTLVISKEVTLRGESKETVLIKNLDSWTNSTGLLSVTRDNVTLQNLTLRQVSSNANAFTVTAQTSGFPFQKLSNFQMIDCKVEYSKHGVYYRGINTLMLRVETEVVAGSGTRYALLPSANSGDSFIVDCHFNHPLPLVANNRVVYLNGIGGPDSDRTWLGSLTIQGCTTEGFVSQFVNHDSLLGDAGGFDLIVKGNTVEETNAFAVSIGNNLDLYGRVIFENNTLTNSHVSGDTLGKGMFLLSSSSLRSTPLPFFAVGNTLGQVTLRGTEVDAMNAPVGTSLVTITTTARDAYVLAGTEAVSFNTTIPSDLPNYGEESPVDVDVNDFIASTLGAGNITLINIQAQTPSVLSPTELQEVQDILSISIVETGSYLLSLKNGVLAKALSIGWIRIFDDEGNLV